MTAKPYLAAILLSALILAACSKTEEPVLPEKSQRPSSSGETSGEALFAERCRQCHTVHGKGGAVGPELSRVGGRRDRVFLERVIREPSRVYPGTVMPAYDTFSKKQVDSLVDYLSSLK